VRSAGADSREYLQSEHEIEESKGAAVMGRGRWVLEAGGGGDMGAGGVSYAVTRGDCGVLATPPNSICIYIHSSGL